MNISKSVTGMLAGVAGMLAYDTAKAVVSEVRSQYRSFIRNKIRKIAKIDDVTTHDLMKDSL
jgi:hypothetical protein